MSVVAVSTSWRTGRWMRGKAIPTLVGVAFLLPASGCADLEAVSKFATESSQALKQGRLVLEDIEASCIRAHVAEEPIPADVNQLFDPSLTSKAAADPACAAYASHQPGELAVLKVLTDYYTALSQLASTGSASTGKGDSSSSQSAKETSSEPENVLKAVDGLAGFLGKVAAGGYRERALEKDLKERKDDVAAVVSGLKDIVQNRYENHSLVEEQQIITRVDLELLGKTSDDAVKALYRAQWESAMDLIAKKKAAADAFVKALDTMQDGYTALTDTSLKAKDLPSVIQPYTEALSSLIPSIQKAL
jgi:hypothetical protein